MDPNEINTDELDRWNTELAAREKKPGRWLSLFIVFSILCSWTMLFFVVNAWYIRHITPVQSRIAHQPGTTQQPVEIETHVENHALPARLVIPRINVDAAIQLVGVESDGAMGAPRNTVDVGWFGLGPRPGERGSAVIAGHFNGQDGRPGVFTHLDKLKPLDPLYIQNDNGTSVDFVVRESRTFAPGYANEVFAPADNAHLNLVTCEGVWNELEKSYSKRLVVFADIAQ